MPGLDFSVGCLRAFVVGVCVKRDLGRVFVPGRRFKNIVLRLSCTLLGPAGAHFWNRARFSRKLSGSLSFSSRSEAGSGIAGRARRVVQRAVGDVVAGLPRPLVPEYITRRIGDVPVGPPQSSLRTERIRSIE